MLLSILIPTLPERKEERERLINSLLIQKYNDETVEIVHCATGREMSIGNKRNELYSVAMGKYSVQIDDDDMIAPDYIERVLKAIKGGPDCIGYKEHVTMNGIVKSSIISIKCESWQCHTPPLNGFDYYRTPHFKTPILTSLCQQVGVKDMRYGEDHDFAKRIYPLLKNETFINADMYFYTGTSLTVAEHNKRYGK